MREANRDTSLLWRLVFDRTSVFAPLLSPQYRTLWAASVCWHAARWMDYLMFGWLALELTDSVWPVALISFYRLIPLLVFGIFGGALGDRFDRRRILIFAQIISLLVSVAMVVLLYTGEVQFDFVAACALLMGIATAVDWPSRRAVLPETIRGDHLVRAVLLDQLTNTTSRFASPIIAGLLIATHGVTVAFAALALIQVLGLLLLMKLVGLAPATARHRSLATSPSPGALVWDGLRYVRRSQVIFGVVLITVVMNLLVFPFQGVLPVFARDILHTDARGLGLLAACNGIGATIMSLIIASRNPRRMHGWIYLVGSGTLAIVLMAFAMSDAFLLSVALLFLSGLTGAGFSTMQSLIVLEASTQEMRTRSTGALTVAIGSTPIGSLILGQLASRVGVEWALFATCALATLLTCWVTVTFPHLRRH